MVTAFASLCISLLDPTESLELVHARVLSQCCFLGTGKPVFLSFFFFKPSLITLSTGDTECLNIVGIWLGFQHGFSSAKCFFKIALKVAQILFDQVYTLILL